MSVDNEITGSGLRLGDEAPGFTARSTKGLVSLSDYRGGWLMLFSHPADFTPVCTSEFIALGKAQQRFADLGCKLLALSIDSLFSHFAWIRAIREISGVSIDFPIIEDPTLVIARAYGMIGPDSDDASSVRATYFLDPNGILRASTTYPFNVGRSVDELIRLMAALRRVDDGSVLAPEGWTPGANLLSVPSQELDDVLESSQGSDWFFRPTTDVVS